MTRIIIDNGDQPTPTCRLRLVEEDGSVHLKARDKDGDDWYLATISENGLELHSNVWDGLGLALDKDNEERLRVSNA